MSYYCCFVVLHSINVSHYYRSPKNYINPTYTALKLSLLLNGNKRFIKRSLSSSNKIIRNIALIKNFSGKWDLSCQS